MTCVIDRIHTTCIPVDVDMNKVVLTQEPWTQDIIFPQRIEGSATTSGDDIDRTVDGLKSFIDVIMTGKNHLYAMLLHQGHEEIPQFFGITLEITIVVVKAMQAGGTDRMMQDNEFPWTGRCAKHFFQPEMLWVILRQGVLMEKGASNTKNWAGPCLTV